MQCEWEKALKVIDQAVIEMPRTHHRLSVFLHIILIAVFSRDFTSETL